MSHEATSWARRQRLHRTPKAVLMYLAGRANSKRGESCFPGQKLMADELGMSVRTVRNAVMYLEETGFIERWQRRRVDGMRTSDGYELLISDREIAFVPYAQWLKERAKGDSHRQDLPVSHRQEIPESPARVAGHIKESFSREGTERSAVSEVREVLSASALADAREKCAKLDDQELFEVFMTGKASDWDPQDHRYGGNLAAMHAVADEIRRRYLENGSS